MLKIYKSTVHKEGSCNYCNRGKINSDNRTNLVYPYETVYVIDGKKISSVICEDCLKELQSIKIEDIKE